MSPDRNYVIGVDFGTDSCRAVVVDATDGSLVTEALCKYPRWAKGLYCDPAADRYRQHPLDYLEAFSDVIREVVARSGPDVVSRLAGISFDTTASTPALVDREGDPLALSPEFAADPDAMFILWKDHTAKAEAEEINGLARNYPVDYTAYSGGLYSPEWAWSKVLHVLQTNPEVAKAAWSWVEHCDWMTAWITGNRSPETAVRSRCAAGHKAMWRAEWGGLPSEDFLSRLDPALGRMRSHLYSETVTADHCAGVIRRDLAEALGLPDGLKIGSGSVDAHVGAAGASIAPGVLTRIIGTSTCDILVGEPASVGDRLIPGICGQVDGSVVPGLVGFEAGQSAFGDVYAWFRSLLLWPVRKQHPELLAAIREQILPELDAEASALQDNTSTVLALDWLHGRRTPDLDPDLKGALTGLTLGTSAPMIYRALVEATAFGSKAIAERFLSQGVPVDSVLAVGGISQKSPFVMQTLADVIGMPIRVMECNQACALGAAMFASVAAGIHPDLAAAQQAMQAPLGRAYLPDPDRVQHYRDRYRRYRSLGSFVEQER